MKRLIFSILSLAALAMPATAGFFDYAPAGGGSFDVKTAAFYVIDNPSGATDGVISQGDILQAVFEYETVGSSVLSGESVLGVASWEIGAKTTDYLALKTPTDSAYQLYNVLSTAGFTDPTLQVAGTSNNDATFGILYGSSAYDTTATYNAGVAGLNTTGSGFLGLTTASHTLDMLAGLDGVDDFVTIEDFATPGTSLTNTGAANNTSTSAKLRFGISIISANVASGTEWQEADATTLPSSEGPISAQFFSNAASFVYNTGDDALYPQADEFQFTADSQGDATITSTVPEPSSLAILGLIGVAGIVSRRKRS